MSVAMMMKFGDIKALKSSVLVSDQHQCFQETGLVLFVFMV